MALGSGNEARYTYSSNPWHQQGHLQPNRVWISSRVTEFVDADPGCEGEARLRRKGPISEADTADHRTLLRGEAGDADD